MEKLPLTKKIKNEINKQRKEPKQAIIFSDSDSHDSCIKDLKALCIQKGRQEASRDSLVPNSRTLKKHNEQIRQTDEEISTVESHLDFIAKSLDSKS